MAVDVERSVTTEDQMNNPNRRAVNDQEEVEELEEGEIAGGDDSSSLNPSMVIPSQPHPLEHSWTFWCDNPSSKSKQVPWGASIRPIYTFSTVEDFWGCVISQNLS